MKLDLKPLGLQSLREAQLIGLGAVPGLSPDIRIFPTNPISQGYRLEGVSAAGRGFLLRVWQREHVVDPHDLARLKALAAEWGLTHETDFGNVTVERIDP